MCVAKNKKNVKMNTIQNHSINTYNYGKTKKNTSFGLGSFHIDHADVVVTHSCNRACQGCVDLFRGKSNLILPLDKIKTFFNILDENARGIETPVNPTGTIPILVLGGEPTMAGATYLNSIANMAHERNFLAWLSTNGDKQEVVKEILPHFDIVHITVSKASDALKWLNEKFSEHLNIKLACNSDTTLDDFKEFAKIKIPHKSVIIYHDLNLKKPKEVPLKLDLKEYIDKSADWSTTSNAPYLFREIDGVVVKRPVEGNSVFADSPIIPKIYPNGNYGNSWTTEEPQKLFAP